MGKTRLKVGVFVIVSFVIIAGAILWLAGSRFLQPGDSYSIIFSKSVSGLLPGAAVEYQGVTVGKVEKIRLTPDMPPRVAVTIFLEPETPVRQDTTALLVGSLVTGIQIIELEGGSAEAPPLQAGGTIPVKGGEFEAFRDSASQIAETLLNTLTRIEQDILSEENRAAIGTFLQNVALLTENLRVSFAEVATPETRASLKAMVDNLAQAAAGIKNITETVSQDGKVTMVQIRETADATETLAREVAQLTRRIDQLLVENRNQLGQMFTNLADTSRRLNETVDTIRRDPSVVVWGSRVPEKEIPDK